MIEYIGLPLDFVLTEKREGEDICRFSLEDVPIDIKDHVVRGFSGWTDAKGEKLFFGDLVFPVSGYFSRVSHEVSLEGTSVVLKNGSGRLWLTPETVSEYFHKVGNSWQDQKKVFKAIAELEKKC